jgi:hypothetical protein
MVYNAMEWMAVLTNLAPIGCHGESCPAQERLRGWLCGNFLFTRRPYADSRVPLTEGRKVHISGRGDVLSSRVPTALGRVLQWPRWLHNGGDGCTGPKVTGETRSTGLMSRRRPTRAWGKHPYLFRGFRRPLSRGATWRLYESGRHSVTELTPAFPHSSRTVLRMATQGGLVEQRRDIIPRRCQRVGVAGIRL